MVSLWLKCSIVKITAHCLLFLISTGSVLSASESNVTNSTEKTKDSLKPLDLYLNLFKVKRKEQLAAIQKMILVEDVSKQAAFVKVMMETIIQTLSKAMLNLEMNNYVADQGFPKDDNIRDDLSKVLENTALFTDLIVRFPQSGHIFYQKEKKTWKKILHEAIDISSNSGVFTGDYDVLLHSLKQELGIGLRDEKYKNPFIRKSNPSDELTSEERKRLYNAAKSKQKLKKKKRTGPKMTSHSEL